MSTLLQEKLLLYKIRSKGDAQAFGKLYDLYVQRVYRFIYFKVRSVEEAQDCTAESFLKLWQYLQDGKRVTTLGALVYEIARNVVFDHYRKMHPHVSLDGQDALEIPDLAGLAHIRRSAELSEVLAAVRMLKDEYREVLTMRYIDGIGPSEIATLLGKSPGAVRVLLHRSLETVRALLAPESEDDRP